eukprot:415634_1
MEDLYREFDSKTYKEAQRRIQLELSSNEPSSKKRKLNDFSLRIQSSIFLNSSDHSQFQQLFTYISNSELSQSFNLSNIINKEIAEFATGQWKQCSNPKCCTQISVLCQDEQIYGNNHENAHKLGYKMCVKSGVFNKVYGVPGAKKYYCIQCMDLAISCDCSCCDTLYLPSNCDKCDICKSDMCNCGCILECMSHMYCVTYKCNICDLKTCNKCNENEYCSRCDAYFCYGSCGKTLCVRPDEPVCNNCYDKTIIECDKCDMKCELFYKSNGHLVDNNEKLRMRKCKYSYCDIYICLDCDDKETTDYSQQWNNSYYCNRHKAN